MNWFMVYGLSSQSAIKDGNQSINHISEKYILQGVISRNN